MSEYPEHDKLLAVKDQTQAVGEFIDWVHEVHGAELMIRMPGADVSEWYPVAAVVTHSLESLLAEWSNVDLKKIEQEKRAMLKKLSELNEEDGGESHTLDTGRHA